MTARPRDIEERLIERRDDLSVEAAEVIAGLRGGYRLLLEMLRQIKELPP